MKRKGCLWGVILLVAVGLFPFGWRTAVQWYYAHKVYAPTEVPANSVAIVFGAGIYANGRLSDALRDRMDVAIQLYHTGQVKKLLLSGDNQFENYNEPAAMMAYALEKGIPLADIQPDYGGRRTYDTCYRAKHIFGVETAVLVTQTFHLSRALFTCNTLGIEADGVEADLQPYVRARWYEVRETAATLAALWDVVRSQPAAVMGDPIPLGN